MRSGSTIILAIVFAVIGSACSSNTDQAPSESTSSTVTGEATTTLAEQERTPLEPETTAEVARSAITTPDGYSSADTFDTRSADLVVTADAWVPVAIVTEVAHDILSTPSDGLVSVVSVIPTVEWRGAPDLPEILVGLLSDSVAEADEHRIVATESADGTQLYLWSTGDGFLIVASADPQEAVAYLEQREALREPLAVWADGTCLMLPGGEFPYAPFPIDLVVPCSEEHNAEVIAAEFAATSAPSYDAEAIEADRSYACDEAYSMAFGPDIDHRPGLVTYMPDEGEWSRGDRYRACVVSLSTNGTTEVFEGRMAEREDLVWNLEPGDCLPSTVKEVPLNCTSVHVHEFMGTAEVPFGDWPAEGDAAFDAACEGYLDEVTDGPVDVGIWGYGLGPYEFEQGARTVRCLAFAIGDTAPTLVGGTFTGDWRTIGDTVSV